MDNYIVTIAREYGSGGRLIGKELAKELDIAFYDRELIVLAAKESGSEEFVQKMEYKRTISFINNLYMTGAPGIREDFPQCKVIRQVRRKVHDCGRCADYVLRDVPNCIRSRTRPDGKKGSRGSGRSREEQPNLEDFIRKTKPRFVL